MTTTETKQIVADIARRTLGIQTLEEQNRDSLDFHDLSVVAIREALLAAFNAGRDSAGGRDSQHCPKSLCTCGHTGDGPASAHDATIAQGHGACRFCNCQKFSWAAFIDVDPTSGRYTVQNS